MTGHETSMKCIMIVTNWSDLVVFRFIFVFFGHGNVT